MLRLLHIKTVPRSLSVQCDSQVALPVQRIVQFRFHFRQRRDERLQQNEQRKEGELKG